MASVEQAFVSLMLLVLAQPLLSGEIIDQYLGKQYLLQISNNYADVLGVCCATPTFRKAALHYQSREKLIKYGNQYKYIFKLPNIETIETFTPNWPFYFTTSDGRNVISIITIDGATLHEVQIEDNGRIVTINRAFSETQLKVTIKIGHVILQRTYDVVAQQGCQKVELQEHERSEEGSQEAELQKHERSEEGSQEAELQEHERSEEGSQEAELQEHERSEEGSQEAELQEQERSEQKTTKAEPWQKQGKRKLEGAQPPNIENNPRCIDQHLEKKYELIKSINYDEILKALGVQWYYRANVQHEAVIDKLIKSGELYTYVSKSQFGIMIETFAPGVPFPFTTAEERNVTSTITIDGATLHEVQVEDTGRTTTIDRTFSDTQLDTVIKVGHIVATAHYKLLTAKKQQLNEPQQSAKHHPKTAKSGKTRPKTPKRKNPKPAQSGRNQRMLQKQKLQNNKQESSKETPWQRKLRKTKQKMSNSSQSRSQKESAEEERAEPEQAYKKKISRRKFRRSKHQ